MNTKQLLFKSLFLAIAFSTISVMVYGDAITKSLFMQIKAPKLESASGILIDQEANKYMITGAKDSVDISFMITVPKEMLSEQWAISLTPSVESTREDGRLQDVVIRGWKFAEAQEEDYMQYNEFMNSIVDSSQYEEVYIDKERLTKEIEERHDQYWKYYYDEWERQIEFEKWKSKQDGSSKTFSLADRKTYRDQLYKQYLLRIKNQSSRYLKADMDTTGLHARYMKEFEQHDAKMPRFIVDNEATLKSVPHKYRDIYESRRTLDDITNNMEELLVKRDSALMALLPALDYKKIRENEKRTLLQNGIREDIIRLPKSENTKVDTIVYDVKNDYQYLYTYRYPVIEGINDTIEVKLASKILATDRSGFSTTAEESLTYVVAAESQTPISSVKAQINALNGGVSVPEKQENTKSGEPTKKKNEESSEALKNLSDRLQNLGGETQEVKGEEVSPKEKEGKETKQIGGLGSRLKIIQ